LLGPRGFLLERNSGDAPAESRIVLGGDATASTLLGRSDLLFKNLGAAVRLQSPFVEEQELQALL
jgi:DNA segregation ATPase FtsK/SpoIIIE-like protein